MTRARDNSFNPFNNQVSGKNLVINGAFDHWQRGTSFASSNSAYVFTADRWEIVRHGYQLGMSVTRQTAGLDGFRYCARIQRDSGNTSTNDLQFQTSFETSEVLPFINKTMTISFYARRAQLSSSSSLNARIISGTGTDQAMKNYTGGTISFQQTFTLTTSWQRFSFSGVVSSPYTEFGVWFGYNPTGTANSEDYYEVTGVQVELGSSATQFSRAGGTIGGELALCQRYYQKSYDTGTSPGTANTLSGIAVSAPSLSTVSSGLSFGHVPLKVEMRAAPSITIYSFAGTVGVVSNGTPSDLAASSGGVNTIGTRSFSMINNSGGSITPANGSFIFHYVANAEL